MPQRLKLRIAMKISVSFKVKIGDSPCIRTAEHLKALTRIVIKTTGTALTLISTADISFRLL
jgi:hypothetical protein